MKTHYLTFVVGVLLLFCFNGTKAQTNQSKLDQIELCKQWIGYWKAEIGKETTFIIDCKSFYSGYEFYLKQETRGKIIFEQKSLMGYDQKNNRFIESAINSGSKDIILFAMWFTSENKCEEILLNDVTNPEKAMYKWIFEFKSPELLTWKDVGDNKVTNTYTFHREI